MNELNNEKNIKEGVLAKIKSQSVHQHSRLYFILRLILTIVVTVIILIVSVFLLSFIFFSIHEGGEQFLLGFGGRGIETFFILFPWLFLLVDIILLLILEWLLHGFKFAYRISLLGIFLIIFASSIVLGLIVNLTSFHNNLLNSADRGELPILGEPYEKIHNSHSSEGIFKGVIVSIDSQRILIDHDDLDHDTDDGVKTIVTNQNYPELNIGDYIYIFGHYDVNGEIVAENIEILPQNLPRN